MKCFEAIRRLTASELDARRRGSSRRRARGTAIDSASLTHAWPIRVPTNVGPPPIRPSEEQEAPARPHRLAGERRDDPEALGRVVQAEADDQDEREADLAGRAGLADRQALGEVVQADPGRDQQRQPRATPRGDATHELLELRSRRRARAEHRLAALALHPAVVVDEAQVAGSDAAPRRAPRTRRSGAQLPPSVALVSAASTGSIEPWMTS